MINDKDEKPIVTVNLREDELRHQGFKQYLTLVESGQWNKYNNDYSTRIDRRPENQGGIQLHIRNNHSSSQWAYRGNGKKSEPTRFNTPSTRMVQQIVRDRFKIDQSVQIEAHFLNSDSLNSTLICEASLH